MSAQLPTKPRQYAGEAQLPPSGPPSRRETTSAVAKLRAPGAKCPAGLIHDLVEHRPMAVEFRMEPDRFVSATCCGRDRGVKGELHVLDDKNNRKPGVTRSRASTCGSCCRVSLSRAKLTELFLTAESIELLPDGKLPALTRDTCEQLRVRFRKPNANVFILTHVCAR
jgi:hypothetical protein